MSASEEVAVGTRARCADCGVIFPPALLACPACQRLLHAATLSELAQRAAAHAAAGAREAERTVWREALVLLPEGSRQHAHVLAKLERLAEAEPTTAQPAQTKPGGVGQLAGLGAIALLLWKFKWLLAFVLTKGKLLLVGLTKMNTLLSMALTMGVYWTIWGLPFALGFVLGIYVHEMGHVAALRKLGIPASAPMFIPGLGAFVRMHQYPATPSEDAEVGLAGPIFGLGAALACFLVFRMTEAPIWGALTHSQAFINLFNLVPVWQLDGGRGFRALDRKQRWQAVAAIGVAWFVSEENLLFLLGLAAAGSALLGKPAERPDRRALLTYCVLIGVLAWLCTIEVPLPPRVTAGGS